MDSLTKEQRKKCMSHIRSKDTGIEVALRKALWRKGYRYRKNYKELPGTPDIVLSKYHIAIFCPMFRMPSTLHHSMTLTVQLFY